MKNDSQSHAVVRRTPEIMEPFFREVEIQFLIHELKDPVSIIETGARSLLEKTGKYGALSERQEKTLKRVLRNTHKVWAMLNDLLEVGRSEAGCFLCSYFRPAQTVMQALLDAVETTSAAISDQLSSYTQERDIVDCLARSGIFMVVPASIAAAELYQDETKFRQIVGNLFKNALYHRQQRIDIRMGIENDYFSIAVTDDGPGVEPQNHEFIFRRYTQIKECSTVPRKGHGLGLAGALILARCLGGNIELDSQKGQGATFQLTLPVRLDQIP
jgi:two-component system, OmpR family, sensor kinase